MVGRGFIFAGQYCGGSDVKRSAGPDPDVGAEPRGGTSPMGAIADVSQAHPFIFPGRHRPTDSCWGRDTSGHENSLRAGAGSTCMILGGRCHCFEQTQSRTHDKKISVLNRVSQRWNYSFPRIGLRCVSTGSTGMVVKLIRLMHNAGSDRLSASCICTTSEVEPKNVRDSKVQDESEDCVLSVRYRWGIRYNLNDLFEVKQRGKVSHTC